ncbi:MAG: hypothetical protein ACPGQS_00150 [Bradymonadia bacterium]
MKFNVVTPTGAVIDTDVSEVTVPGALGEFTVLPEHRPAVLMVGGGRLSYVENGSVGSLYVKGGIVEIGPEHVTVLTDIALDDDAVSRGDVPAAENFDHVDYLTEDLSMRKRFDDNFHQAIAR